MHSVASETDARNTDVNDFLPIEDEVKEWLDQFAMKSAVISVTLQEYLVKDSSKISLGNLMSVKSASKQHLANLVRFYTFCVKGKTIQRQPYELDAKFLGLVLDPKYSLGFLLQVVK